MMKVHIPLQEKSTSTDIADNFLVQKNNIYVMDNHRLALWSWLQSLDLSKKYNLMHIDAHPDLSENGVDFWKQELRPIHTLTLDEYRTVIQPDINIPLFRWDNYIQFFLKYYAKNLLDTYSFTHKLGSASKLSKDFADIHLLRECEGIFNQSKFVNDAKWIVNLDLDFFFTSQPHKLVMYSDDYIDSLCKSIRQGLENNLIEVLTIAFSPECCGSWQNAEALFEKINNGLDLKIKI